MATAQANAQANAPAGLCGGHEVGLVPPMVCMTCFTAGLARSLATVELSGSAGLPLKGGAAQYLAGALARQRHSSGEILGTLALQS